jgi:hypothetical protein
LDVLGFVANPLGSLVGAGIGWLIERISFLKEPLDDLAGDPAAINSVAAAALASSWFTFGASLAAFTGWAVGGPHRRRRSLQGRRKLGRKLRKRRPAEREPVTNIAFRSASWQRADGHTRLAGSACPARPPEQVDQNSSKPAVGVLHFPQ